MNAGYADTSVCERPVDFMSRKWTRYAAQCGNCRQHGLLHVWTDDKHWGFVAQGVIGVAVNRHNPVNSVVRCNACQSPVVEISLQPGPVEPES